MLAWNEETGELSFERVTATIKHTDEIVVHLTIDGEEIETTPEHPFYVEGKGWVNAEELQLGDEIRKANRSTGEVESVTTEETSQEMYNLTIDEAHTFFVGDGQWLVHNVKCDLFIPTSDLRFSQSKAAYHFGDKTSPLYGKSIDEVAQLIKQEVFEYYGVNAFVKTPEMDLWPMTVHPKGYTGDWGNLVNGEIYVINNRGLSTGIEAGLEEIPVRWVSKDEIINFSYQYDTPNKGVSIRIEENGQFIKIIEVPIR